MARFDPLQYKHMTQQQWQAAVWNRGEPTLE